MQEDGKGDFAEVDASEGEGLGIELVGKVEGEGKKEAEDEAVVEDAVFAREELGGADGAP
jgi:hypothetical protein